MEYDRCLSSSSRLYDQSSWYPYPTAATMYSLRDQQDYPSPAPSDPSPGPRPYQQLDHAPLYGATNEPMAPPFSQIESSIGPDRVTRRHSSIKQGIHGRRSSLSTNYLREQESSVRVWPLFSLYSILTITHQLQSPIQMPEGLLPRVGSPSNDRYGDRSSLHGASPHLPPVQLSPYHPGTPTSSYSPYEHAARRSRTRSDSTFDGRGNSPASSSNSGRTPFSPRGADCSGRADSSRESLAALKSSKDREPKHHKHRLRDVDRKNICIYHHTHPNARQEDIGSVFGVERSTISKILKDKDRWLNISEEDESNEQTSKHRYGPSYPLLTFFISSIDFLFYFVPYRPSKFPEVEEEMLKALQGWSDRSMNITDQLIRTRALEIATFLGISPEKFKGSSGWIENFKHRHDIKRGEWLKAVRGPVVHRYGGSIAGVPTPASVAAAAAVAAGASSGMPPTPVLMPYDQNRLDSASDSRPDAQANNRPPLPSWGSSHTPQHDDGTSVETMVIDPALQGTSSSTQSSANNSQQSLLDHHHEQHVQHTLEPLSIQHSPTVSYSVDPFSGTSNSLYGPGVVPIVSGPAPSPRPSLAQAEEAINTLIAYLDQDGRDILKEQERQTLTDIKCALFQHASGLTYERPT